MENGTENQMESHDNLVSSPEEGDHMKAESDHMRSHDTKMPLDLTHSHVIEVQPRIPEEEPELETSVGPGNDVELSGKLLHTLYYILTVRYSLYCTLCTLHFTIFAPHWTLYIKHYRPCTIHYSLQSIHYTLCIIHCTL